MIPTDVIALMASAVVAIAVFLPWYSINFTAFAVQRLEAAANGLISGFLGHSFTLPSLPAGPYSLSISALDKNAGGWRWAILIVACVAVVELLIAISVRASGGSELPWPHAGVVALLTFGNLVLVAVSLFVLPISGVSSSILTVSIQSGAVVGTVGAAVAFLSALAAMFTTEPIRR